MGHIQIGRVVPRFKLPATGDKTVDLKSLRGKIIVLYFYPKDNTPGCTTEGCDFKANHLKFKRRNAVILGISRDSIAAHEKFKAKFGFPFDLLSDADEKACQLFDVIKEKNMYGRKVMGIERSTFLIDAHGKLQNEWRKVKVKGHVEDVLDALQALQ
ncbi:MAG: peroxiredoxin [Gammaproteobacteria bacterium]|nr:peroxiredoxin [Gammaproteobacteria bacterium]